jgi:threonine aldolase
VPAALASPTGDAPHEKPVHFLFDGVSLTPLEYSELLVRLCKGQGIATDTYLSGGSVQELETTFARVLRKETAVFLPTGTLANHLAIRILGEGKSRALVQAESHIYNDSMDRVQALSHVNLVPLANRKPSVPGTVRASRQRYPFRPGSAGVFPARRVGISSRVYFHRARKP